MSSMILGRQLFVTTTLKSWVAIDWGKDTRDHGVKNYAKDEGPPTLRFTVRCQNMSYEVYSAPILNNVSKWA